MEHDDLVTLVVDIVSAYVSSNNTDAESVPTLIGAVYSALASAGNSEPALVEERLSPAVSVRASVKPDVIICLDCGFKGKLLKRHLSAEHGLTPTEYKARWYLPEEYPLITPAYSQRRKEIAMNIGLGRKPGQKRGRKKSA